MNEDRLVRVEGVAAALPVANINTDIIAPPGRGNDKRDRYGPVSDGATRVFGPWRYCDDGTENPEFVLNQPPFRDARFLVAGDNFGCGSSRETAPKWLRAFGIRCIIAPSFGGIFFDNCFRNGILPLSVAMDQCSRLADEARSGESFVLDMTQGNLTSAGGLTIAVSLPAFRRALLVEGMDDIATIQANTSAIDLYQASAKSLFPWVWPERDAQPD